MSLVVQAFSASIHDLNDAAAWQVHHVVPLHAQFREPDEPHTPYLAILHHVSLPERYRRLNSLEGTTAPPEAPSPPQDEASDAAGQGSASLDPSLGTVAVVRTASELLSAASEGVDHIQLQEHLDLAAQTATRTGSALFEEIGGIRTVVVRNSVMHLGLTVTPVSNGTGWLPTQARWTLLESYCARHKHILEH